MQCVCIMKLPVCMCAHVGADGNHEWPWISGKSTVNVKSMLQINHRTPVPGFSALFWKRHALGLSEGEHTCCTIECYGRPHLRSCTHTHTADRNTHEYVGRYMHLQTRAGTHNLAHSVLTENIKNKRTQAHSHNACITHHTVKEHS